VPKLIDTASLEKAEVLALQALDFLAQDTERFGRFLALSGIGPAELKDSASAPATLAGVLEYLMQDESALLVFCSLNGHLPQTVAPARQVLADAAEAQAGK
jgi:uncharacterized protein DUF3572